MNVLSLFDGISCGQIALERAGIKVDNYFASEIDKYAIQITQKNYPNTIQLGDVTQWHKWDIDWSSIDIVAGGSPCFEAGTKIITSNGYKNIEDIVVGDEVLTHKNRLKKVLRTGNTYGDIYEVSAQGMLNTYCTENHPYYVREMKRKWFNAEKKVKRTFSEPTWVEVKDLHKGHFIGLPINQKSKNSLNLTKEEAYIIGRYIADGHTRKDYRKEKGRENDRMWSLILSVGENKLKKFENNLTIKYTSYKHSQSTYRCVFYSKRLVEIVEKHCLCGAGNKRISQELLNLPIDLLKGLLDGYMEGDGCIDINDTYHATTISRELAMSLCLVVAKVYRVNCNIKFNKNNPQHIIEGRLVNQHDSYTITFSKYTKKQCNAIVIDDMVWLPIKSIINKNTKNKVYNLEVEEDNSYTANNIIVHNCTSFSQAGLMEGFNGESKLFFEFADILHNTMLQNPKVNFLLENVVMKKEWRDVISNIMGVEPIEINSNLVSAQNRRRLYWTNIENIKQPQDKGIYFKDVLEDILFREIPKCMYDSWGNYPRINGLNWINNKKSNTLTTSNSHTKQYILNEDKTLCRLFTPIEYERLQTLPDNEINCIFALCLDQVKNYVNAVEQNPKLLKLALSAEKEELNEFVKLANQNTKQNNQLTKCIVQQGVDMMTQRQINQCTKINQKENNTTVNNAENTVMCQSQNQEADSVLPNAFINITEGRIMHFGTEELHRNDSHSTNYPNGKKPLVLFGSEIMELVKDVDAGMKKNSDMIFTSTTLSALSMSSLEQMLATYYLFAKNAINGYIPNKTNQKSLSVQFQINDGYTYGIPNTQRFKAIGNGWTIEVIAHIFKYII